MTTLLITAEKDESTVDGMSYHFTRNNIDYSLMIKADCVDVWKTNNQRGTTSNDCFWNGVNNQGKKMPKVIRTALGLIAA